MPEQENDWSEWRNHVLAELKRLSKNGHEQASHTQARLLTIEHKLDDRLDAAQAEIAEAKTQIAVIKGKAAVVAAVVGAAVSLIAATIEAFIRH